ncbi:MAG: D-alanyl-D-alanine carboxypeptidase/D-alanyl-D-alanine-endopeptidase [Sumerlaeia bacterium]
MTTLLNRTFCPLVICPLVICLLAVCVAALSPAAAQEVLLEAPAAPATQPAEPALDPEVVARIDALLDDPKYADAFWGVRIETPAGHVLYDRLGDKNFVPASNMKLLTTAAALDLLGPEYTYSTRLFLIGGVGEDGTLEGDVLIVGSGDPSLGAWHPDESQNSAQVLEAWTAALKEKGVERIAGHIIGDGRFFTEEYLHDDWEHWDLPYWYAAGSSGLAMEENAFRIHITPGEKVGDAAEYKITPDTRYVTILNKVKTAEAGGKNNADAVARDPGNVFHYERTVALDGEVKERGSILDGERYAAFLFKEALERAGVAVAGEAVNIRALDPETVAAIDEGEKFFVTATESPPLSELVKVVNVPSHNFFADQILRTLGAVQGEKGSFSEGAKVVEDWLGQIGAESPKSLNMRDGSGLSRKNYVQPRHFTAALRHMVTKGQGGWEFFHSLPVGGESGTLSNRFGGDEAVGSLVRAKTGYIGYMRGLSGYAESLDGKLYVFSLICNRYSVPTKEVNATQDAICTLLVRGAEGEAAD